MTPVNAEGESVDPPVPAKVHEKLIDEAATSISRLQGETSALVNALTAIVLGHGDNGELLLTPADMDRIEGHYFAMSQDPTTKVIKLKVVRRTGASLALSAAQELENRRAAEVALPKSGLVRSPSGIIVP